MNQAAIVNGNRSANSPFEGISFEFHRHGFRALQQHWGQIFPPVIIFISFQSTNTHYFLRIQLISQSEHLNAFNTLTFKSVCFARLLPHQLIPEGKKHSLNLHLDLGAESASARLSNLRYPRPCKVFLFYTFIFQKISPSGVKRPVAKCHAHHHVSGRARPIW